MYQNATYPTGTVLETASKHEYSKLNLVDFSDGQCYSVLNPYRYIIKWIRIQVRIKLYMDPDPEYKRLNKKYFKQITNK